MSSSELSGAGATSANESQDQPNPASVVSARRSARAELIWEGKYDANGRRVAPPRIALPFQTVETVAQALYRIRLHDLWAGSFNSTGGDW
jgi:hypothetical protein